MDVPNPSSSLLLLLISSLISLLIPWRWFRSITTRHAIGSLVLFVVLVRLVSTGPNDRLDSSRPCLGELDGVVGFLTYFHHTIFLSTFPSLSPCRTRITSKGRPSFLHVASQEQRIPSFSSALVDLIVISIIIIDIIDIDIAFVFILLSLLCSVVSVYETTLSLLSSEDAKSISLDTTEELSEAMNRKVSAAPANDTTRTRETFFPREDNSPDSTLEDTVGISIDIDISIDISGTVTTFDGINRRMPRQYYYLINP
jgi:hypothetical protein